MARSAAGDRQAFDLLAGRYMLRLRRSALRVLGDPAAAEDAAQDTLLRAWMRAASYDPKQASVSTWLHRIAVNAAIDRVRATRPTIDVPETLLDPAIPADLAIAGQQRRQILAEAIASLPDRQRQAITLTYEEGWSGQEAARALSVSTRALEGLLHRGRKLVRAYLEAREA
ncbi:MAG TPA: sigma-70 family RNA polymerase sigma factor [Acetobacteraceae bacterium]|nr:sigma-70 family RNA polymerase sigma factor [Acetobacteraceae bacterium]